MEMTCPMIFNYKKTDVEFLILQCLQKGKIPSKILFDLRGILDKAENGVEFEPLLITIH